MVVIWGMPSCCCKGRSKLVLGCWTNSCAPRRKVLLTLLKNSGPWTLFLLLHYCILCSFITKCIIYLFTVFVGLTPWIYKLHENRDLFFIPDCIPESWSVPVSEVTEKKNCGICINKCVCVNELVIAISSQYFLCYQSNCLTQFISWMGSVVSSVFISNWFIILSLDRPSCKVMSDVIKH